MKELEKTRRISISAVLFLLVIVVSLLTFRKPEFNFMNNSAETLEIISTQEHLISLVDFNELNPSNYQLIDVRNNFDFSKGHIPSAINIPLSQLLESIHSKQIQPTNQVSATILYGESPEQANAAWMLLYQLGYENIKLLSVNTYYDDREYHTNTVTVGTSSVDYAKKMKEASTQKIKKIPAKQSKPKKKQVVPKPKKKKKMPEGGC